MPFLSLLPLFRADLPTVADRTKGLARREGLLPSYIDARGGSAYFEIRPDAQGDAGEFLYREALRTGVGSNDLGLDRGQLGATYVVRLVQRGDKVLMEAENTGFRAGSGDPDEVQSVRESFPTSVLWSFPVVARDADGRALLDATGFAVRDAHGAGRILRYGLDAGRSALEPVACKAFPQNLEFEARLTFAGDAPLPEVAGVSPDPRAVTVVEHQSLVRLPDPGYRPKPFDPVPARSEFRSTTSPRRSGRL